MAITNHDRVGKALETVNSGLTPFVEREMKSAFGGKWFATAKDRLGSGLHLGGTEQAPEWDTAALLKVLWECWNEVFAKTLGRAERSMVNELRDVRNKWAHQKPFSTDDAYRALDSMHRLLNAVGAGKEADELERQKAELMRVKFDEQARHERRKTQATLGLEAGTVAGTEAVAGSGDAASRRGFGPVSAGGVRGGFVAGLSRVARDRKTVSDEYADAQEFFRRTFLTVGLKDLLVRAVRRLASDGSDPVVELQTNFGGGKTHSMLALWHLFSGPTGGGNARAGSGDRRSEGGAAQAGAARGAGGQQDFAGPAEQEGRRHGGADAVGRAGVAAWRQGRLRAGEAVGRDGDESRRCAGQAAAKVFAVPDPD